MRLGLGCFSWYQGHGDFGMILEEGGALFPSPAFGESSERVWVELIYPTTLHRDCFIACQGLPAERGRHEVTMVAS